MSSLSVSFFSGWGYNRNADGKDDSTDFSEYDLDKSDRQQIYQQYKGNSHTVIADTRCNQFEKLSHIFLYIKP